MTPPPTSPVDGGAAIYAATDNVPAEVNYLTAKKPYLIEPVTETGFRLAHDRGCKVYCLWSGCAHLDGGDWYQVTADGERVQP